MSGHATHMSLYHLHPSLSDFGDGSWNVNHLLFLYLLQYIVNGNECTCATHTSTAKGIVASILTIILHIQTLAYLQ